MYDRKANAYISEKISWLNVVLKLHMLMVRWLYYNHFIFFYIINIHLRIHDGCIMLKWNFSGLLSLYSNLNVPLF